MTAKYFDFEDGQRLPGERVKEFLMNQAVIQCENQTEITGSGIELLGARVAINLEDGQLWTYTPDIEAWAPAQNTLDLELLDARYYTKIAANGIFISETTADARYLTEVTARGIFLTETQANGKYLTEVTARGIFLTATDGDTRYYTKLQADGLFLTSTSGDVRYYTKLQADGLFMTQTTSDARYYTKLQADGLYLGKVEAGTTYITKVEAGQIYLSQTNAASTYVTQINAGNLFISKGGAAGDINGNNTTIDGGKITTNTINVNRLIAGTLTGFRIQTSSTGQRVVISEATNSVVWFDSGGTERGRITGGTSLNIESSGNGIALQVDGVGTVFSVNGSGVALSPGRNFNSNLPVSGNVTTTGSVNASTFVRSGTTDFATLHSNGGISAAGGASPQSGDINAGFNVRAPNRFQQGTFTTLSGTTTAVHRLNDTGFFTPTGSDERLKENIEEIQNGLALINNLRPVKYTYKSESETPIINYGLIAQEVRPFVEENSNIVNGQETEDEYLSLEYIQFVAPLISAVKELSAKNEALEARLAALEGAQ
jgi:hypothetical protein